MSEKVCIETRENVHYFPDMEKCEEFIKTTIMADWNAWTDDRIIAVFLAEEYDSPENVRPIRGYSKNGAIHHY